MISLTSEIILVITINTLVNSFPAMESRNLVVRKTPVIINEEISSEHSNVDMAFGEGEDLHRMKMAVFDIIPTFNALDKSPKKSKPVEMRNLHKMLNQYPLRKTRKHQRRHSRKLKYMFKKWFKEEMAKLNH